jgi:hypothetical protein
MNPFHRFTGSWRLDAYKIIGLVIISAAAGVDAGATTVLPPTFEQLVGDSDYVVSARVKSVKCLWVENSGGRHIFSEVELEVIEVIVGRPPQPLILRMLGGAIDGQEMVVQGMPVFKVGQEDILFVRGNGRQFYPLTAAMHGRYPIVRPHGEAPFVARSNSAPLRDTSQVSLPIDDVTPSPGKTVAELHQSAISPDEFVRKIKAAAGARSKGKP